MSFAEILASFYISWRTVIFFEIIAVICEPLLVLFQGSLNMILFFEGVVFAYENECELISLARTFNADRNFCKYSSSRKN